MIDEPVVYVNELGQKVLYSLQWINGVGYQPYDQLSVLNVTFTGGIAMHNYRYLGRIEGTETEIESAINACGGFSMMPISDQDAETFFYNGIEPASVFERITASELLIDILGDP